MVLIKILADLIIAEAVNDISICVHVDVTINSFLMFTFGWFQTKQALWQALLMSVLAYNTVLWHKFYAIPIACTTHLVMFVFYFF